MATKITKAQLQAEVEALRHNNELLRTQLESLKAELAAKPDRKPAPVGSGVARLRTTRIVYEFNPNIPGDFGRARDLARATGGIVKRITA